MISGIHLNRLSQPAIKNEKHIILFNLFNVNRIHAGFCSAITRFFAGNLES